MRNLLIVLLMTGMAWGAVAGVYDDILAAAEKAETPKVIDLLQRGMDINTADPEGNTLLMISARSNNLDLLRFLLANRAGVNRRNRFGDTAILFAAIRGYLEAVQLLKEHGAQMDLGGWGVLHYATFAGSADVLQWATLQVDVELDRPAPNGMTALMLAAKQGKLDMVKALVARGAKVGLVDSDGLTAGRLAAKHGYAEVASYLEQNGGAAAK